MSYIDTMCRRLQAEKYEGHETAAYLEDCRRLKNREPYEYVLGYVDFLGATIDLSFRPMIPRLESAFWVKRAIEELKEKPGPLRLADVFAGSGNVGMALLKNLPNATVDISELDPALQAQIEKNIVLNKIAPDRVRVVSASVLEGLTGQYDAIFAIPPYIPYEALPDLDREMIDYEPHLAFLAHEAGHEFHRALITNAWDYLKEGGTLYLETDIDHNEVTRELVKGTKWSNLEFWPDPYGATPNVVLRK